MKAGRGSILVLVLLCAGPAAAQDYRAKVQGIVTDATQAVIVGAKVTLHNDNTGIDAVKTTNEAGLYVFDFVEPGAYTVTVEQAGFAKFVQQNVQVQVRGDVTVNAVLKIGGVAETITVQENVVAIQFNTSTMELTIDRKMLTDLPILARNPFTLAMLDPAVVNRYTCCNRNPFFMWSSSQIDVGGSTTTRNDLLLDGAPIQIGQKGSYAPPMDAVQEFSVQQNSVDAEFGHSAGGILSLGMKSGTNQFHGTAYYFGRNPALNAVSNSVTHTPNQVRNHIWGGTLGNPVIKNKLFAFTAYESWRTNEPRVTQRTLPTDLERQGDYSQSLNAVGGPRTIYDPWTTVFDAASGKVTRTAFLNNRIPASQMDPTALRFLKDIWRPNSLGEGPTGINNYKISYSWPMQYWNFSERIDWNISDRLKIFGRYSRVRTDLGSDNYAGTPAVKNDNGGVMNNRNVAGDVVYLLNPNTVFNARFGFASLEDDYNAPDREVKESGLAQFWPNNPWYKPYIGEMPRVYYPHLTVGGADYGMGSYWFQHPRHYTFFGSLRNTRGVHNWKAGIEGRRHRSDGIFPNLMNFTWSPAMTADTFISPDTRRSGDDWAAFLLGILDNNNSNARIVPFQRIAVNYWAGFFQDDIKLTPRITLNLGLRYEYEGPPTDDQDRLSRYLDLNNPIPEMQATPPEIPAQASSLMKAPYKFNGAWIYTDSSHRGMYRTDPHMFMPRAGVAVRLNNSTAIRVGYARYITPPLVVKSTLSLLPMWGFSALTTVAPMLQGVPAARISDPFPSTNPLTLPVGKQYGRYTNLGDSPDWTNQDLRTGVNDRWNFSVQRQLPGQLHVDVTWFMNFGHDLPYAKQLNLSDPQLSYTYKAQLSQTVPNPFYHYLTPDKFPGPLRNQAQVTIGSLLKPYPQYGGLSQENTDGVLNRYRALQVRVQRPFSRGYTFLLAYNYNQEGNYDFFNDIDRYAEHFTFVDSNNPRHRLSVAGTYDLPFGKGRQYLNNMHPVLNGIFGGWSTSSLLLLNSGRFLRFGQMITDGSNPRLDNKTRDRWFDTSKFQKPEPFTPRTNPWQYPGVVGPKYWSLDATVSKFFPIKERFNLEFKFEAYSAVNNFVPTDPNMNVLSALFGKSTNQENRGREIQYTMRLHF